MKLSSPLFTFSMLFASTSAFSSQEDVASLLTVSEKEKEAFIAQTRAVITEEIKGYRKA